MGSINRRDFLKGMAVISTATLIRPNLIGSLPEAPAARVYRVTSQGCLVNNKVDAEVVTRMLRTGIKHLSGSNDMSRALLSLFPNITTTDKISIKVNCINNLVSTRHEAAMAMGNLLGEMKINGKNFPLDNVIVWDRTTGELRSAGYQENKAGSGIKVYGTDGYSSTNYDIAGNRQPISKIITEQAKYLINFAVAKDHGISGITLTMKNHYGSCKSPGSLHGASCGTYAPALNKVINGILPYGQNLYLVDAIVGVYQGGPGGSPQFADYSIYFSKDQAAIDAVGKKLIDDVRASKGRGATNAPMINISSQSPYNLGVSDLSKIEIVQLEPDEPVAVLNKNLESGIQLLPPSPNPFTESCSVILALDKKALVEVNVFDVNGKLVRQITSSVMDTGINQFQWDGRNDEGNRVATNPYLIQVSTENSVITAAKVIVI